jgi:SAM-dependent methyltransferase
LPWRARSFSPGNVSVYELDQLKEQFDIVLFLGVLYHLTHPMYALTQVRHRVKPGGLLVAESGVLHDEAHSYMHYYYGTEGEEPYRKLDPSNWVLPTTRCMKDMLRANYLEVVDAATCCLSGDPAKRDAQRKKSERRLLRPAWQTTAPVEEIHARQLVLARAVERRDDSHLYEPQFGLARYDARFH